MVANKPLIIAHRGFKEQYAENTLAGFTGALDAGVDILETDVHITADGIVVINHDASTGRVHDKDYVIAETELAVLKTLKNKEDPTQLFLTFKEFVQWFIKQREDTKVILDIKPFNGKVILAKLVLDLLEVNSDITFWHNRIMFGLWRLDFYEFGYITGLLENFHIVNIAISVEVSKAFIKFSRTLPKSFQLSAVSLLDVSSWACDFSKFKEEALDANGIDLYLWTVNKPDHIKRALALGVDGILTDDPVQVEAEIRLYNQRGILYKRPPLVSLANLKIQGVFILFRLWEFVILRGLHTYKAVQLILGFTAKFVLHH